MRRLGGGFTLSEVLIAIAAFVVAILVTLALAVSMTRMSRETVDRSVAVQTANRLLERTLRSIRNGGVPVTEANFWANEYPVGTPLLANTERVGGADFAYEIFATTVTDTVGTPIGSLGPDNRLKKVTVRLNWFAPQGQARAGYGMLETQVSRLVREGEDF